MAEAAQAAAAVHVVCPHCATTNRIPPNRPAAQGKCGNCHQALFSGKPAAVDAAAFERHLSGSDLPVVVDFWAPWCGPCLAMAPALERATAQLEPDVRVLKLNTEEAPAIAARYGIRSIPTLIAFVRGKPVAQTAGAMDANRIVAWVRANAR